MLWCALERLLPSCAKLVGGCGWRLRIDTCSAPASRNKLRRSVRSLLALCAVMTPQYATHHGQAKTVSLSRGVNAERFSGRRCLPYMLLLRLLFRIGAVLLRRIQAAWEHSCYRASSRPGQVPRQSGRQGRPLRREPSSGSYPRRSARVGEGARQDTCGEKVIGERVLRLDQATPARNRTEPALVAQRAWLWGRCPRVPHAEKPIGSLSACDLTRQMTRILFIEALKKSHEQVDLPSHFAESL